MQFGNDQGAAVRVAGAYRRSPTGLLARSRGA